MRKVPRRMHAAPHKYECICGGQSTRPLIDCSGIGCDECFFAESNSLCIKNLCDECLEKRGREDLSLILKLI